MSFGKPVGVSVAVLGAMVVFSITSPFAFAAKGSGGGGKGGGGSRTTGECQNHVDDDGDGYCDFAWKRGYCVDGSKLGDPDCTSKDGVEGCSPGTEACDGVDNDCDGLVDEDGVCDVIYYCDADQDGFPAQSASGSCSTFACMPVACSTTVGSDCDDTNAFVNPAAVENCDANGVDDDCDGTVDECDPCMNGVLDPGETGIDCGGSCAGCEVGGACSSDSDCLSGSCVGGVCAEPATSLAPECRPLKYDNGSLASHVNLVLVPSAFGGDMETFRQKAEWIASIFGNYTPFSSEISRYNVFYVAQEAGDYCQFDCNGIARLLCCDTAIARSLSSTCTTGARQTIVVHNSDTYGGAGYYASDVATTSVHSSAPRIAVHELGHSLFNLGDEYDYGTATASFPNCDYAGCYKWQDLIGYNGVGCLGGYCSGGQFFASEDTIMKSLGYRFEEVNVRLSCCTYQMETGEYPPYCDQFLPFTATGDLGGFCQDPNGTGTSSVPAEFLDDPEEITFARDADTGEWTVESVARRRPGFYPSAQTRGSGEGPIRVDIRFANTEMIRLRFPSVEDVEFPGEGDAMGGRLELPRQVITAVVDRKGRGPVVLATAGSE